MNPGYLSIISSLVSQLKFGPNECFHLTNTKSISLFLSFLVLHSKIASGSSINRPLFFPLFQFLHWNCHFFPLLKYFFLSSLHETHHVFLGVLKTTPIEDLGKHNYRHFEEVNISRTQLVLLTQFHSPFYNTVLLTLQFIYLTNIRFLLWALHSSFIDLGSLSYWLVLP